MTLKLEGSAAQAHVFFLKGNEGLTLEEYMKLSDIQDSLGFRNLFLHNNEAYERARLLHIAAEKSDNFELKLVPWDDSSVLVARTLRDENPRRVSFAYVPHPNLFGNACSKGTLCDAIGSLGFEVKIYRSIPSR